MRAVTHSGQKFYHDDEWEKIDKVGGEGDTVLLLKQWIKLLVK